jgi:imidazolonepropionase-like amidohydrolase
MKQEGHYDQVPKFMREKEMEIRTNFKAMLGKAVKAGVRIALGTDAGTPFNYHGSNTLQLKLYVDDGFFTPVEAIKAGTLTAAEAAGREDRLGSIEPGKQADIVVVDGDCTESLAPLLDAVELVYKAGRLVTGYTPGGTRV